MKTRAEWAVFALTAVVLLLALAWWRNTRDAPRGEVGAEAGCVERCMARDADCEALFSAQGGYPGPEYTSAERRARCRGTCVVLQAMAPKGTENACLK